MQKDPETVATKWLTNAYSGRLPHASIGPTYQSSKYGCRGRGRDWISRQHRPLKFPVAIPAPTKQPLSASGASPIRAAPISRALSATSRRSIPAVCPSWVP